MARGLQNRDKPRFERNALCKDKHADVDGQDGGRAEVKPEDFTLGEDVGLTADVEGGFNEDDSEEESGVDVLGQELCAKAEGRNGRV